MKLSGAPEPIFRIFDEARAREFAPIQAIGVFVAPRA